MRRVVVTGMGIVSSIGNNTREVVDALRQGHSGIVHAEEYRELGLRSQVHGNIKLDLDAAVDRKLRRFMGDGAACCWIAMQEAIASAELTKEQVSHPRTGLIVGSGGGSTANMLLAVDTLRERGARKVNPTMVPRIMSSSPSACLATGAKILGINYSISSACATSSHCIGNAYEMIQSGKQDVMFAGGGDDVHWTTSLLFDAMGALSKCHNDDPGLASRPFDTARDGFVISGGGGILVLEALSHAEDRGAEIIAEIRGYAATSDGHDMVQPSGEGALRCMRLALQGIDEPVDYINAHATGTPAGDKSELEAIRKCFKPGNGKDQLGPKISSTKSLTGHGLGAAGVSEAIYTLLMMRHRFISASANIDNLDEAAQGMAIVRQCENVDLSLVASNSFGFGGTNACLVFGKAPQ